MLNLDFINFRSITLQFPSILENYNKHYALMSQDKFMTF